MKLICTGVFFVALSQSAVAQISFQPAPEGKAAVVAQTTIHDNFDSSICPLVVEANRLGDGTIKAVCNNNESFRVFSVDGIGPVAMSCTAARDAGIDGC